MRKKTKMAVLDFDGTFTDLGQEAAPFRHDYLADVATLVGLHGEAFDSCVRAAEAAIMADPVNHGWYDEGIIVASATVDPYVFIRATAGLVLEQSGYPRHLLERVLDVLFGHHGPRVQSVFKPTALSALLGLRDRGVPVYVVTNSKTDPVRKKLERLGANGDSGNHLDWLLPNIHGSARKYKLDPAGLDAHLSIPGLGRPVYLARPAYIGLLERLRAIHGCEWDEIVVVGDIFELDLAGPFDRGATVGLLHNEWTPEYERAFLRAHHPRAHLVDDPLGILNLIVS